MERFHIVAGKVENVRCSRCSPSSPTIFT
jgi:hypothetical protein